MCNDLNPAVRFARASGEVVRPPSSINVGGWKKVIKRYQRSTSRAKALQLFKGNTWKFPGLKIMNDRDVLVLLALELYFQASGCRFNLIKKLTIDEVMGSTRVPYACHYCKELQTGVWRKHRKVCKKFKKAFRRGQVGKKEGDPWANPSWTIAFRSHKTYRGKCCDWCEWQLSGCDHICDLRSHVRTVNCHSHHITTTHILCTLFNFTFFHIIDIFR